MSQKKVYSIDRVYYDGSEVQFDPIDTIEATEEEIKDLIYQHWNPPTFVEDDCTYRKIEATELKLRTISDCKRRLIELGLYKNA